MEQLPTIITDLISKRYYTLPSVTFLHTTLFVCDLNKIMGWKPIHTTCDVVPGTDMRKTMYVSEVPGMENVMVSWTEMVNTEESRTMDIVLIHPVDLDTGHMIKELQELSGVPMENENQEEQPNVLYRMSLQDGELVLVPLEHIHTPIEIEDFYTEGVLDALSELCDCIEGNDSGLSIICGPKQTGKTKMMDIIPDMVSKTCIFISNNMLEVTFNSPAFNDILEQIINPVFILDDIENHFKQEMSNHNILSNNILQLLEGPVGQTAHVILIANTGLRNLDKNLIETRVLNKVLETSEKTVKTPNRYIKHKGIRL